MFIAKLAPVPGPVATRERPTLKEYVRLVGFAFALAALLLSFPARPAGADELRVRVRGESRLEVRPGRDGGDVVLRGVLVDDAGQGLGGATVSGRLSREAGAESDGGPADAATETAVRGARTCEGGAARAGVHLQESAGGLALALDTDDAGRFCVRLHLEAARYLATFTWPGTSLVVGAATSVPFDAARQALTLRFDPAPRVLALDSARVNVEVVATVDEGGAPAIGRGLPLSLSDERGASLGRDVTDATGRARFTVDGALLGPPGRGELRVAFDGNVDLSSARASLDVERHAGVTVRVPTYETSPGGKPPQAEVPEDGIVIACSVTTVKGAVEEGAVEARVGEVVVGAAPVEHGVARPELVFSTPADAVDVRLRYVPTSPWLRSDGETTIRVPLSHAALSSKAPVLIAGLAVLAFFFFGRLTASAKKPKPSVEDEAAALDTHEPQAGVLVLEAADDGAAPVWRGRVVDAHDRHGLGGANVWIEQGSFEGRTIVARARTDADGHFELVGAGPSAPNATGAQLVAEARLHARHTQALPRPGELSIALVARKRAVLARLVAWARHAGHPFDARPEPTPGHVRRAAARDAGTARWADAIEQAAFGRGDVDADVEAHIDRLRPEKANVGAGSEGPGRPPGSEPDEGR